MTRQESEESLLDACDFDTHSFAGSTVGSRILDQSFVSVRTETLPNTHQKEPQATNRPLIKRKIPIAKEKEKCLIKEGISGTGIAGSAKKKMKAIKVPEKYEKVIDGIAHDSLDTVDLTNAELGDTTVLHILELMRDNTRVKTLKLIRNKLSDEGIMKMIPYFSNLLSLNLSQNQLT